MPGNIRSIISAVINRMRDGGGGRGGGPYIEHPHQGMSDACQMHARCMSDECQMRQMDLVLSILALGLPQVLQDTHLTSGLTSCLALMR